MTKKQLAALQRILEREVAAYRALSGRPTPGQHPSQDKYAICDGDICILLDTPISDLPMGNRVDSLAKIVWDERKSEAHYPVPEEQIDRSYWMRQIRRCGDRPHGILISAPITRPDQLFLDDAESAETPTEVVGKFAAQLLIDAVDAIGDRQTLVFLGFGPSNSHFPSLLAMPPKWTEHNCTKPIALVFPLRV